MLKKVNKTLLSVVYPVGPILFLVYIKDMGRLPLKGNLKLFADA